MTDSPFAPEFKNHGTDDGAPQNPLLLELAGQRQKCVYPQQNDDGSVTTEFKASDGNLYKVYKAIDPPDLSVEVWDTYGFRKTNHSEENKALRELKTLAKCKS